MANQTPSQPAVRRLSRPKRYTFRAVALLLGVALFIVLGELCIRLWLAWVFRGQLEDLSREAPTDPTAEVTLGDLIYPVDNDNLIYRLKPGAAGVFKGAPVRINALGFRDEEASPAKAPGTIRILGLGDSIGFGWGVDAEECFFEVLEETLGRLVGPGQRVEVINTSAPGYNAVMELEILREIGPVLKPDAVIIEYCTNDGALPNFMVRTPYYRRLDVFYLGRLGIVLSGRLADTQRREAGLAPAGILYPDESNGSDIPEPGEAPVPYRHHIGLAAVEAAYRGLRDTCRRRSIPLLVVAPSALADESDPAVSEDPQLTEIRRICTQLELPLVQTYEIIREYIQRHGLQSIDLTVPDPADWHPNAQHHKLIAETMLKQVVNMMFFDKMLEE